MFQSCNDKDRKNIPSQPLASIKIFFPCSRDHYCPSPFLQKQFEANPQLCLYLSTENGQEQRWRFWTYLKVIRGMSQENGWGKRRMPIEQWSQSCSSPSKKKILAWLQFQVHANDLDLEYNYYKSIRFRTDSTAAKPICRSDPRFSMTIEYWLRFLHNLDAVFPPSLCCTSDERNLNNY